MPWPNDRAPPVWIDAADVLAIHDRVLVLHGGAEGLRDEGMLLSALARPRHLAEYDATADIIALAAAYGAGIVRNHPFVDGNKRVSFVVTILFMELNGDRCTATEAVAAEAVLALAAGAMDEAGYAAFLRDNAAS